MSIEMTPPRDRRNAGTGDRQKELREEFKKRIKKYIETDRTLLELLTSRRIDRQAFFGQFKDRIRELTGISDEAAAAVTASVAGEELADEILGDRERLKWWREQFEYRSMCVDKLALPFLKGLTKYEFLNTTGSGVQARVTEMERHAKKLAAGLGTLTALDHQLGEALKVSGSQGLTERYDAIRQAQDACEKLGEELEAAASAVTRASQELPRIVETAAMVSYFEVHPTDGMKAVLALREAAEEVLGAATVAAPPLSEWIPGLVKVVMDVAERVVRKELRDQAAAEYEQGHFRGDIFQKYTDDPLLMAAALNSQTKRNVKTALTIIGVAADQVKFYPLIESGIEAIVDAWLERRIELAKEELERLTAQPDHDATPEGTVEKVLKEMRDSFASEVGEELKKRENWVEVTKQVSEGEFDTDWAVGLMSTLFKPIAEQLVKVLPVTAAQLVSGKDLTGIVDASFDIQSIPEKYRKPIQPDSDDDVFRHPVDISVLVGTYRGTVVDSVAQKDEPGPDGQNKAYVAFMSHGTKVWGFLVGPQDGRAEWVPTGIDATEGIASWRGRRITADGWEDDTTKATGGTWYRPKAEGLHLYRLYVPAGGAKGEWLRPGTQTRMGRAEKIFEAFDKTLATIDLDPDS